MVLQSAGGGGYGDPLLRPAAQVAHDVREGYVTEARALECYGVVLRGDGSPDDVATKALRSKIEGSRLRLAVSECAEPLYAAGRYSRHRICRLNPEDAATLGAAEDDILELVGKSGPALRAWAVIDPGVAAGTLPLDELGRRVVAVKAGERLYLRRLGHIEVR